MPNLTIYSVLMKGYIPGLSLSSAKNLRILQYFYLMSNFIYYKYSTIMSQWKNIISHSALFYSRGYFIRKRFFISSVSIGLSLSRGILTTFARFSGFYAQSQTNMFLFFFYNDGNLISSLLIFCMAAWLGCLKILNAITFTCIIRSFN